MFNLHKVVVNEHSGFLGVISLKIKKNK